MTRLGVLSASLVVTALATTAVGQPHLQLQLIYGGGRNGFSAQYPDVEVRLFARFSPSDYALAGTWLNIHSGESGWHSVRVNPILSAGSSPGVVNGGDISNIIAGQIHFPPFVLADDTNPILVWQAVWTTSNFALRDVPVWTQTIRFDVYPSAGSPTSVSRLAGLSEAHATIQKVPTPSSSVLLAAAWCWTLARRRRRAARPV